MPPPASLFEWCRERLPGSDPGALGAMTKYLSEIAPSGWLPSDDEFPTDVLCLCATLRRLGPLNAETQHRIAQQLSREGSMEPSFYSELSAAALLRRWGEGLAWIGRVKDQRSADFRLKSAGGWIEVEVTRADEKLKQQQLADVADDIRGLLSRDVRDLRFCVYFLDVLTPGEIANLHEAATRLETGKTEEVPGRWFVAVGGAEDLRPANFAAPPWWPEQVAEPFSVGSTFALGSEARRANQIEVHSALSLEAYINPLQKKADRPQFTASTPGIIAVDISAMVAGLHWFPSRLPDYFPGWSRVSGVVLFVRCVVVPPALAWMHWLGRNNTAQSPLPTAFAMPTGHGREVESFWPSDHQQG